MAKYLLDSVKILGPVHTFWVRRDVRRETGFFNIYQMARTKNLILINLRKIKPN